MKKKGKKTYSDDDGRVIAPMNIDGMPWFNPKTQKTGENKEAKPQEKMTRKEMMRLIWNLYSALIPIALIFIVAFGGLIAFMVFVWLK
ncbi:MAG: hypothetical protein PHE93_01620 [Clostridia bacterium]|nr:hypothetical protein [Clostridia bacterium]